MVGVGLLVPRRVLRVLVCIRGDELYQTGAAREYAALAIIIIIGQANSCSCCSRSGRATRGQHDKVGMKPRLERAKHLHATTRRLGHQHPRHTVYSLMGGGQTCVPHRPAIAPHHSMEPIRADNAINTSVITSCLPTSRRGNNTQKTHSFLKVGMHGGVGNRFVQTLVIEGSKVVLTGVSEGIRMQTADTTIFALCCRT